MLSTAQRAGIPSLGLLSICMLFACVTVSPSNATDPPQTAHLSAYARYYKFRAYGAGALCSQYRPCRKPLVCDYFHGGPRFGLGICKRQIPVGYPCANRLYVCKKPSHCVNSRGGLRCRLKLPLGGKCSQYYKLMCRYGLTCKRGRCVSDGGYGARCDDRYRHCRSGFTCGKGKCKLLLRKGQRCGFAGGVCAGGNKCVKYGKFGRRCVGLMNRNGRCSGKFMACRPGLKCLFGKCVAAGRKGSICGTASTYCGAGLTCEKYGKHERCVKVMKKNGNCGGSFMGCDSGLKCVGPSNRKRCLPASGKGAPCSPHRHSYKYCASGLTCYKSYCYGIMKPNQNCSGKYMACTRGYKCVGPKVAKKCRPAVGKGYPCYSEYDYCKRGLTCYGEGNTAKCYGIMGINGRCDGAYMKCKGGLSCRGPIGNKRCVRARTKGQSCDNGYRFCASGLVCRRWGNARRCVGVMGLYGDCNGRFMRCQKGLSCVGPRNAKKCVATSRKGGKCDQKYLVCARRLRCIKGRCSRVMGPGQSCAGSHMTCARGFYCRKSRGTERCLRPVRKGYVCDHPRVPHVFCRPPFVCYGKGARARCIGVMNVGGSCEGRFMVCKRGLSCVGRNGHRKCAAFAKYGQKCGRNYPRCSRGLVCYAQKHGYGLCYKVQALNEKCGSAHTVCGPGLSCIGKVGYQKCTRPATIGEKCGPYYKKCGSGQKCVAADKAPYGTCHRVVGRNYSCEKKYVVCGFGTKCAGVEGAKQCVKPMGYLQRCDDPYWVCGENLKCVQVQDKIAKCVRIGAPKDRHLTAAVAPESEAEPPMLTTVVAPKAPKTVEEGEAMLKAIPPKEKAETGISIDIPYTAPVPVGAQGV